MKARKVIAILSVVAICILSSAELFAAEIKFQIGPADTVKSILEKNVGKRVLLKLQSGQELSGTVTQVGEQVVQLSELSGMEFYDAVVRIDGIGAVIVRVRDR